MKNIMIKLICFYYLLQQIKLQKNKGQVYESPCERIKNPTKPEECYGKSCEFIEETCCYLESIVTNNSDLNNIFNETWYECVDFAISDYERENQKQIAIEQIKNGTYWAVYTDTYADIILLKCKCNYLFSYGMLLLLLFWFLFVF